tara:strand:- start:3586 stop:4218 length:633 start_codon:yes stop_codon:yes gene_type:complete
MEQPDTFMIVILVGVSCTVLSYVSLCDCVGGLTTEEKRLSVFPFMVRGAQGGTMQWTMLGRAWRLSMMVFIMSQLCLWFIIWTRIKPQSWDWLIVSQAISLGTQTLWLPATKYGIRRGTKWMPVLLQWIAALVTGCTVILFWRSETHGRVYDTDVRVAVTFSTMIFWHILFWDAYIWSAYFTPDAATWRTMQNDRSAAMPVMGSSGSQYK